MPKEITIELDVVNDQGEKRKLLDATRATQSVVDQVRRFNVQAELKEPIGPGGGWPVFAFTGTRLALVKMLSEWYLADKGLEGDDLDEEIAFLLGDS